MSPAIWPRPDAGWPSVAAMLFEDAVDAKRPAVARARLTVAVGRAQAAADEAEAADGAGAGTCLCRSMPAPPLGARTLGGRGPGLVAFAAAATEDGATATTTRKSPRTERSHGRCERHRHRPRLLSPMRTKVAHQVLLQFSATWSASAFIIAARCIRSSSRPRPTASTQVTNSAAFASCSASCADDQGRHRHFVRGEPARAPPRRSGRRRASSIPSSLKRHRLRRSSRRRTASACSATSEGRAHLAARGRS